MDFPREASVAATNGRPQQMPQHLHSVQVMLNGGQNGLQIEPQLQQGWSPAVGWLCWQCPPTAPKSPKSRKCKQK